MYLWEIKSDILLYGNHLGVNDAFDFLGGLFDLQIAL